MGYFYGTTDVGGANARGYGLQNHPQRHADDALQLLFAKRLHGRRRPRRGAGPGHRWELLRDNGRGRDSTSCGTVFKITPSGTLTTLYSFCSQSNCTDGASPVLRWSRRPTGTSTGRLSGTYGVGTIFKITLGGKLTTLYTFCSQELHRRHIPIRGADPGHQWDLLRDNA